MVSIIALLIILVIAALIIGVIAAAVKESKPEGGNMVIKNVYIYLVLFATLMMTIGGSVAAFMAVADIVFPAPYYQSFEEYKQMGIKEPGNETANLSDAELESRYEAMVTAEIGRQKSRAQNNLVKSLGWIVVPLPVFVYYQRRLREKTQEL
ncbi:hypothetical protein ASZ90_020001 [hydrocarbon metagenome]|uniref:DUF5671 domain-containing protein n=1 Tax=hydrocarbon metagenome TaxID=938273 RepID=A0A0W8E2D9_9ZZZZ